MKSMTSLPEPREIQEKDSFLPIKVVLGITVIIGVFLYQPPKLSETTKRQSFVVVNKYNGCDVVQYESGKYPQYVYLLDCKNK